MCVSVFFHMLACMPTSIVWWQMCMRLKVFCVKNIDKSQTTSIFMLLCWPFQIFAEKLGSEAIPLLSCTWMENTTATSMEPGARMNSCITWGMLPDWKRMEAYEILMFRCLIIKVLPDFNSENLWTYFWSWFLFILVLLHISVIILLQQKSEWIIISVQSWMVEIFGLKFLN